MKVNKLLLVISCLLLKSCTLISSETCKCGQRNRQKIVNGQEAAPHEFPWQAVLKTTSNSQFCSGSLIKTEWVVTAAHCVHKSRPDEIMVGLGEHDKTVVDEVDVDYAVSEIHSFLLFNLFWPLDSDIALIKLQNAVIYNEYISPVCLPFNIFNYPLPFSKLTVSGWGAQGEGLPGTDILSKTTLLYVNTLLCRAHPFFTLNLTPNMICGFGLFTGPCYGDSGGPLVWEDWGGTNYLIGIVSFGINCYVPPAGFTKVLHYVKWILLKTGTDDFCSAS